MDWATVQARFAARAATVWGWFRAGIKLLTAVIGLVLIVAIVVISTAWIAFYSERLLPGSDERGFVGSDVQFQTVAIAHDSVKRWVINCVGALSIRDLPGNLQSYFSDSFGYSSRDTSLPSDTKRPTIQEMSIVS